MIYCTYMKGALLADRRTPHTLVVRMLVQLAVSLVSVMLHDTRIACMIQFLSYIDQFIFLKSDR